MKIGLTKSPKRLAYISGLVLLAIAIIIFQIVQAIPSSEIVIYDLSGVIMTSGSTSVTPKQVKAIREEINSDDNIKAAILFIDSPGGTIWASEEIANEISKIEKPVVASLGEMAASGGYYIACYCDKIVTYPTTLTGSIGVIMQVINFSELMDKVGVRLDTYSLGKYKDIYSGTKILDDNEKEIINNTVTIMYNHFVNIVAKNRGLNTGYVRNLATGQIYTGYEAVQLGLADQLGTIDDAVVLAAELAGIDKYDVKDMRFKESMWSNFYGKVGDLLDMLSGALDNSTKVEFQYK